MNKKDISKVIEEGSARQRVTIIAEDDAHYNITGKGFLTKSERQSLEESFKTPAEGKIYNKYLEFARRIGNTLLYLNQLRLLHEASIGYLTGFCLLWDQYLLQANSYNQLLSEAKSKAEKEKIIKTILGDKPNAPRLGTIVVEGNHERSIAILTSNRPPETRSTGKKWKPMGIEKIINIHSKRATDQLKEGKALAKALLEYMEEQGLNVKTHKKIVRDMLYYFSTDRAILPPFSKKALDYSAQVPPHGIKIDKRRDMEGKYMVFPDPNVEPDPERVAYWLNYLNQEQEE